VTLQVDIQTFYSVDQDGLGAALRCTVHESPQAPVGLISASVYNVRRLDPGKN